MQKNHRSRSDSNNINHVISSEDSTASGGDDPSMENICKTLKQTKITEIDEPVYEIKDSAIIGRYLVAGRDLVPGDVVMKVAPIVIGPCTDSDPVCLGCYVPIEPSHVKYK